MQKGISFEATAIAQYIYQNNISAIKERPQETSCFSICLDTQQNKNCSKVLSQHGTELWMPDCIMILFFGSSVMLTTDCIKWQTFRPICILMKFDHIHILIIWKNKTFGVSIKAMGLSTFVNIVWQSLPQEYLMYISAITQLSKCLLSHK